MRLYSRISEVISKLIVNRCRAVGESDVFLQNTLPQILFPFRSPIFCLQNIVPSRIKIKQTCYMKYACKFCKKPLQHRSLELLSNYFISFRTNYFVMILKAKLAVFLCSSASVRLLRWSLRALRVRWSMFCDKGSQSS